MTLGESALIVSLLVQFAGLVWGASKISSAVGSLKTSVEKLTTSVEHLDTRVHDHEVRVSVLERVDALRPRPVRMPPIDVYDHEE